jgi:hypothetical protein
VRPRLRKPSPALVISLFALFISLGGTTYAIQKLPKRSVGPAQLRVDAVRNRNIKAGAVSRSKIRLKAVTSKQVGTDSLLGRNILESSLTKVPDSDKVDGLDSSRLLQGTRLDRLVLADGQTGVLYRTGSVTLTARCSLNQPQDIPHIDVTSTQPGVFDKNGTSVTLTAGVPADFLGAASFDASTGHLLTADGTEIPGMSLYGGAEIPGYANRCVFGGWILAVP